MYATGMAGVLNAKPIDPSRPTRTTPARPSIRIASSRQEMKRLREFDYVVVNRQDLLEDAVADVESIIKCEHCRTQPRKVVL